MSPWFKSSDDGKATNDNDGGHKYERIQQACNGKDVDKLRGFAASEGGLLDDELRRKACMAKHALAFDILS